MLIKDLICNDDFDVNCTYAIYDCRNNKTWHEDKRIYYSSYDTIADWILNLSVRYITIDTARKCLVIEAK